MTKLELPVEATKSVSGLHAARAVVVLIHGDGSTEIISKPSVQGHGTYRRGVAGVVKLEIPPGSLAIHAWLILNSKGHIKGLFKVYNDKGELVLEARLTKRKIRRLRGDPKYSWSIEKALEVLGLSKHVRRYNWDTGVG